MRGTKKEINYTANMKYYAMEIEMAFEALKKIDETLVSFDCIELKNFVPSRVYDDMKLAREDTIDCIKNCLEDMEDIWLEYTKGISLDDLEAYGAYEEEHTLIYEFDKIHDFYLFDTFVEEELYKWLSIKLF
jgi:hypothetical protein